MGIYMHGNEQVIEYNEIYDILNDVQDFGAIYYGRDPSDQGNIIRYNYIHDVGGPWGYCRGIYLDDGTTGGLVYGNIVANMRNDINHTYSFSESQAVLLNGGSYNRVENNLILNTPVGVQISSIILSRPQYIEEGGLYDQRLKRVNYQQSPYSEKYPKLVDFFEEHPDVPKGNVVRNNVCLEVPVMFEAEKGWDKWLKKRTAEERKSYEGLKPDWSGIPLQNFSSNETNDYLMEKTSSIPQLNYEKIRQVLPEFKELPIDKMGRQKLN